MSVRSSAYAAVNALPSDGRIVRTGVAAATSQIRTLPSAAVLASRPPPGSKPTVVTRSGCPSTPTRVPLPARCSSTAFPEATASSVLSGLNAIR